jgi:hypothetical protein
MSNNHKIVKLSQETIQVLKTFSSINNSLAFTAGNELKTMNASGSIICSAVLIETFPIDFNVYELNKFLSILSLPSFKDAELVFEEGVDNHMTIRSTTSTANIKYFFSSADFAKHPGRSITLPYVDVKFTLTQDMIDSFQKTAAILGHKNIKVRVQDKQLTLLAEAADDSSNDYTLSLGENDAKDFDATIKLENLKLVPGDFEVEMIKVPGKGISKFEHKTRKITTFIALEIDTPTA